MDSNSAAPPKRGDLGGHHTRLWFEVFLHEFTRVHSYRESSWPEVEFLSLTSSHE